MYKQHRKGNSTAWPLILINYNICPDIHTRLENIICVGVIPGPRQFKDLNSFLVPLLEELLQLESGIDTFNSLAVGPEKHFCLHAFLIVAFCDIPALSKLLGVKGHDAACPCRTCGIIGITDDWPKSTAHYVPLTHPDGTYWDPHNLPMCTPAAYARQLAEIRSCPNQDCSCKVGAKNGINSRCILSALRSIDIVASFPDDFMHLIFESLVPNMIKHWTGTFKHLD